VEQGKTLFLSDKEVSKLLGVGRQTLANWRGLQKGPRYVKSGRLVRYAVNDILAYMEARKIGTQDQPREREQ
jgi:predicted DNA-binding transcriptional regulator AlpA